MTIEFTTMRRSLPVLLTSLLFVSSSSFAQKAAVESRNSTNSSSSCEADLRIYPGSILDLRNKAEARRGTSASKRPRFVNPQEELAFEKMWKGEKGPRFLERLLPEGVNLINHELKNNEGPGVVKVMQPDGQFLMLRVEMPFEGRMVGFNVTVSAFALRSNLERSLRGEKLWLLGPDIKAAVDWGHGGGSNSTGGHTVEGIMSMIAKRDNFGSISMDQFFHGEGPRQLFKDVDEYLRFRVAFIKRYVHPNVRLGWVGHSMGGLNADIAFRRSDIAKIGLSEVYRFYLPLAPVPDYKPGGTIAEKVAAARAVAAFQHLPENKARIAQEDLDLGAKLEEDGKALPFCWIGCEFFSAYNDWTKRPKPTGKVFARYVASAADALTVGAEELMLKHVATLPNTELIVIGVRVSREGDVVNIGHMQFDHLNPIKDSSYASSLIRAWMETSSGVANVKDLDQNQIEALFSEKYVKPFMHPVVFTYAPNNYASVLLTSAYLFDAKFKEYLDAIIRADVPVVEADQSKNVDEDGDPVTYETRFTAAKRKFFLQFGDTGKGGKGSPVYELFEIIRESLYRALAEDGIVNDPKPLTVDAVIKFLKFEGNTLAFREFLETYAAQETAKDSGFLNKLTGQINTYLRAADQILKQKDKTDKEKAAELEALTESVKPIGMDGQRLDLASAKKEFVKVTAVRKEQYVPESTTKVLSEGEVDPAAFAVQNRVEQDKNHGNIKAKLAEIVLLNTDVAKLEKTAKRWKNKLAILLAQSTPPVIARLREEQNALRATLKALGEPLEAKIALAGSETEQGKSAGEAYTDVTIELQPEFEAYGKASAAYQEHRAKIEKVEYEEALAGSYSFPAQILARGLLGEGGTLQQIQTKRQQIEKLAWEVRNLKADNVKLAQAYASNILPGLKLKNEPILDILNDPDRVAEVPAALEAAIKVFQYDVWGHRPPTASMGLY